MSRLASPAIGILFGAAALVALFRVGPPAAMAETAGPVLPAPALDLPPARPGLQTAVFAGGCFWGVQGVFQHVQGVTRAVSGYAGGARPDPSYDEVSTGATGHAEAVRVTFDPARVSYARLLHIFFTVALDPTQKDRQGPDVGTQYRSELFVDGEQEQVARAYVAQLDSAHVFAAPIATRIGPAGAFYAAEDYHQDYLQLHPNQPYIAFHDMPKVRHLQAAFPESWRQQPALVRAPASGS